ncbi:MAG: TGS domain-containing protein [Deltaproteobacteria bacterium]|nr:TGS domain-containing protein [Deltaproteobacteria bacterium]MBT6613383.1 TGS domain-containing protein [Deltaproteobacteria bacterium]
MPTNLPPDYFKIEKRYKSATSQTEKITILEEMLTVVPKHKGTDKLRADLRKRISKLKIAPHGKKNKSKMESAYLINREGGGQVAVIGPANVGKSALVDILTNANPEVSSFPHSTWRPLPAMLAVKSIQIQLIDTPPISSDYTKPELFDLIRRVDLILLMADVQSDPFTQLEDTRAILEQHKIAPLRLKDRYEDQRGMVFIPIQVVLNKNDDDQTNENVEIFFELVEDDWPAISISAETGRNLEQLKEVIFERLEIIRIYSKTPGKACDMVAPFVLRKNANVEQFATRVHEDFSKNLKHARVWGEGVFDGQMVKPDHILHDGDIVELYI